MNQNQVRLGIPFSNALLANLPWADFEQWAKRYELSLDLTFRVLAAIVGGPQRGGAVRGEHLERDPLAAARAAAG
jgi:hypothetical protein